MGEQSFFFSQCQLLWQDENRDKYYELSTWNRGIIDIALKVNGEIFKILFVRKVTLLLFVKLKSPAVHMWDVIIKWGDVGISGIVAIIMSGTCKNLYTNLENYWSLVK